MTRIVRSGMVVVALASTITVGCRNGERWQSGDYAPQPTYGAAPTYPAPSGGVPATGIPSGGVPATGIPSATHGSAGGGPGDY